MAGDLFEYEYPGKRNIFAMLDINYVSKVDAGRDCEKFTMIVSKVIKIYWFGRNQ